KRAAFVAMAETAHSVAFDLLDFDDIASKVRQQTCAERTGYCRSEFNCA
ncbi:unnamed protein product, partial [marine sediment metagenome]